MSAHTPGPWTVDSGETLNVRRPDGGILCQLHWLKKRGGTGGRVDGNENDANARLIAAAPMLAEALREIVAMTDEDAGTFRKRGGTYRGLVGIVASAALEKAGL